AAKQPAISFGPKNESAPENGLNVAIVSGPPEDVPLPPHPPRNASDDSAVANSTPARARKIPMALGEYLVPEPAQASGKALDRLGNPRRTRADRDRYRRRLRTSTATSSPNAAASPARCTDGVLKSTEP